MRKWKEFSVSISFRNFLWEGGKWDRKIGVGIWWVLGVVFNIIIMGKV